MAFLLVGACDSPTSDDAAAIDVRGTWQYHAFQEAPALEIEGTLRITEQTGTFFTGTAAFTETDVQGTRRTRAGAISGSFVGSTVIDFDIHIEAQARRHVGRVAADSITGNWSVTNAALVNGSFQARKQ